MVRIIVMLYRFVVSCLLKFVALFVRRDEKRIAFGSWGGRYYIDNSRYLLETALDELDESYRFAWIGNEEVAAQLPKDERIVCLKKDSLKSVCWLMKAKYMFCSQLHPVDLCSYNVYDGAVLTYLHHGCAIKKWGDDQLKIKKRLKKKVVIWFYKIIGNGVPLRYFVVSSMEQHKTHLTAMKSRGYSEKTALFTGTPRNDLLINATQEEREKAKLKYSELLGFAPEQKVVMYVPTFRRDGVENQSLIYRDADEKKAMSDVLQKYNAVLIEKAHNVGKFNVVQESKCDNMIQAPQKVNLQEMLLFTDCIISDYSSTLLDFALMNRPIVNYLYDYEFYRDENAGLYYAAEEFAAGPVVYCYDELLKELDKSLADFRYCTEQRQKIARKFMEFEDGQASKKILKQVLEL